MKRRDFIKRAGITAAGVFAAPYILPAGRLMAASGARIANHVVLCLFAGGVRNLESIQKADGNLMPSILSGTEPISSDIAPAISNLPGSPLPQPLQKYGTLYKEFRFAEGPTGHYSAHTVALTGRYTDTNLNIREAPKWPTVFELYRKHNSPAQTALNAWWVSNTLGPYPALNYSSYPGYGSLYGANFIQPTSMLTTAGFNALGDMREFTTAQRAARDKVRNFLDKNFATQANANAAGLQNDASDEDRMRAFIADSLNKAAAGQFTDPWNIGANNYNNDMRNLVFAEEIIREFQPELLVVNMQDVDVCHFDFTRYADNLHKADYAVARLWETIQSTPGMMNDTIMIVAPEHGRNFEPNTVLDAYGRYAIDHTAIDQSGDQMSREIFCLVLGPDGVVVRDQEIGTVTGESIDIVPTIARVLGFDDQIPAEVALMVRVY
ncbi:MAG: hypothetical protein AAF570_17250, partial [Bacteroidota bacterium]